MCVKLSLPCDPIYSKQYFIIFSHFQDTAGFSKSSQSSYYDSLQTIFIYTYNIQLVFNFGERARYFASS